MASGYQSSPALSGFRGVVFFILSCSSFLFSFLENHMSQHQVHTPRKRVCVAHTHRRYEDNSSIQHGWGSSSSELTRRGHSEALAHLWGALLGRATYGYDVALNTHLEAQLCENGAGCFIQLETQLWPGGVGSRGRWVGSKGQYW